MYSTNYFDGSKVEVNIKNNSFIRLKIEDNLRIIIDYVHKGTSTLRY